MCRKGRGAGPDWKLWDCRQVHQQGESVSEVRLQGVPGSPPSSPLLLTPFFLLIPSLAKNNNPESGFLEKKNILRNNATHSTHSRQDLWHAYPLL